MVEFKNNYTFGSLLLAFALIVGGVTYNLVPTGNYKVCDNGAGWQLNQETGQYQCGDRSYDCVAVRSTKTGKANYFCDEATRVEVKTEVQTETKVVSNTEKVYVDKACPDFVMYTDQGKSFCSRYADGTQKCGPEFPYVQ